MKLKHIYGLFAAAMCAAVAASCDKPAGPGEVEYGDNPITFQTEDNWGDSPAESKATTNISTGKVTFQKDDKFGVFAIYSPAAGESSVIMNNVQLTYDGSSAWNYSAAEENTYFWPVSGSLSFYSYFPANNNQFTTAAGTTESVTLSYSQPSLAHIDLMAAKVENATFDQPVPLSFEHILSRVILSFTTTDSSIASYLTGAGFSAPSAGTFTYGSDKTGSWTTTSATMTTVSKSYTTEMLLTTTAKKIQFFVLPMTLETTADLNISLDGNTKTANLNEDITVGPGETVVLNIAITPTVGSEFTLKCESWAIEDTEFGGDLI